MTRRKTKFAVGQTVVIISTSQLARVQKIIVGDGVLPDDYLVEKLETGHTEWCFEGELGRAR